MLLLIDNYDSFTYNLYQYLCELGAEVEVVRNVSSGLDELIAPGPEVRDVPRIRPLAAGALDVLRWLIILVPPSLVLIVGALLRVWRA